jgi:hypothetical protein
VSFPQSSECQAGHWTEHRFGCSALPKGKLTVKEIAPDKARDHAHRVIEELLLETLNHWL